MTRSKYRKAQKFSETKGYPAVYRKREYATRDIVLPTGDSVVFADIALWNAMRDNGDAGCWLDDKIAYYVSPDDNVREMIDEYLD